VVNRVNVFNNRTYSADPAILAWNVMNEPRNPASQRAPGQDLRIFFQIFLVNVSMRVHLEFRLSRNETPALGRQSSTCIGTHRHLAATLQAEISSQEYRCSCTESF